MEPTPSLSTGSDFYHYDALGNVTRITNNTGQVVESYSYDVFGTVALTDGNGNPLAASAVGNRFMFTGREYIQALGLYDYRNRVYSPAFGRFLQTDPIRFDAGDVNIYRYAMNNVTNSIDPSGLDTYAVRANFNFGVVQFAPSVVIDDSGNIGTQTQYGAGLTGGISMTGGVTLTTASSIYALEGNGQSAGLSGGVEGMAGEVSVVWGNNYSGTDFGIGVGAGLPISPSYYVTHTDPTYTWRNAPNVDPNNPASVPYNYVPNPDLYSPFVGTGGGGGGGSGLNGGAYGGVGAGYDQPHSPIWNTQIHRGLDGQGGGLGDDGGLGGCTVSGADNPANDPFNNGFFTGPLR
ncbi:MAG: RHS repeat-associated core domain-containing protein [Chthoniobacteraceae bacterium]